MTPIHQAQRELLTPFGHLCSKQTAWEAHIDSRRTINLRGRETVYIEDIWEGSKGSWILKITWRTALRNKKMVYTTSHPVHTAPTQLYGS